jgi:ADP-ribose pyrophosphatase YjhB (NUDIX family)
MEIAAVGAVVRGADGRLLLILRGKEPAKGCWSLPGGRVEPGETHEEAVVREVAEETGLLARVVGEVGTVRRDAPGGGVYVIRDFLVEPVDDREPVAGDDADDARWVTPDELLTLRTSPGLVDALRSWSVLPQP